VFIAVSFFTYFVGSVDWIIFVFNVFYCLFLFNATLLNLIAQLNESSQIKKKAQTSKH